MPPAAAAEPNSGAPAPRSARSHHTQLTVISNPLDRYLVLIGRYQGVRNLTLVPALINYLNSPVRRGAPFATSQLQFVKFARTRFVAKVFPRLDLA